MKNAIEILRAIYLTEVDFSTIKNFEVKFTEKEKEFIFEFKRIYEFGINQLEKFIDKLVAEHTDFSGDLLKPWEIEYFVSQLFNGPLGPHTYQISKDKKYFMEIPDVMGTLGNNEVVDVNIALVPNSPFPLGVPVDIYNKCPEFVQENIVIATKNVENLFRVCLDSAILIDNTLPIIDKNTEGRIASEASGAWSLKPNGNYLMKDSFYRTKTTPIKQIIFEKVRAYLQEDQFKIFKYRKEYNPFNEKWNDAISKAFVVEREETETVEYINDDTEDLSATVFLDLFGNQYDSDELRARKEDITKRKKIEMHVENPEDSQPYELNVIRDQIQPKP